MSVILVRMQLIVGRKRITEGANMTDTEIDAALKIVIDLARQNVIDIRDDAMEYARQMEAIEIIEAVYFGE
jgi:hypothetical protein